MSEIRRFILVGTLIAALGFTSVVILTARMGRGVGGADDAAEVRQAILLSDQLEIDAERYLRTDRLPQAYADQALQQTMANVDALRRKGQYRVSELKGIDFQKIEVQPGGRAQAHTVERWVYALYVANGRRLGYADEHEVPQMNTLEKRGAHWFVVQVDFATGQRPQWHADPPVMTEQQAAASVLKRAMAATAKAYLTSPSVVRATTSTYDGEGQWEVQAGQFIWHVDDNSSEAEPADDITQSFEQGVIQGPGLPGPTGLAFPVLPQ